MRMTGVVLAAFVAAQHVALASSPSWQPKSHGIVDPRITVVAVDPRDPRRIYASSRRAVYQSLDGGMTWRERFRAPNQTDITFLAVDPFDGQRILVATTNGLYGSSDGGRRWRRLFRGAGAGERLCQVVLFHPLRREQVFLGTAGGLFVSPDGGQRWEEVAGQLEDRAIYNLTADLHNLQQIYALTDRGLFVTRESLSVWEEVFQVPSPDEPPEDLEQPTEDTEEESAGSRRLTALVIDPQNSQTLYLASLNGVFFSENRGVDWQRLTELGLGTSEIRHLILHTHSPAVPYAATPQGVARYLPQQERWETLYAGLPTQTANFLAATETKIFAATDQGLYAIDLTAEQLAQGTWPHPREILANFVDEPTIEQVQARAIHYAEVHPDKIRRWRRQAYLKGLFPTFSIDYDRDEDTFLNAIGSTTNPAFDRIIRSEDPAEHLDFSVSWDIGDLIWNDDQTSIDVRSKLMVQLRDDVIDEVTRSYFERRRLQVELLTDPPSDPKMQLDKELRLQELTAMIDGLTGGWFSQQLEINGGPQ